MKKINFCLFIMAVFAASVAAQSGGQFQIEKSVVARLRPISFTWKDHPERDLGLAAEEVATVEPLLVTHNAKGEIEGVKYDHLNVVIINAIKQQQKIIESQQRQIDALKKFVCLKHKKAFTCKDKK